MRKRIIVGSVNTTDLTLKVRRSWGSFRPTDRVVESKKVYNRKREKRKWDNGGTL